MADNTKGKFDLCAFCPSLCMDRCPVVAATGRNTWTPQSKMMTGWLVSKGHRPRDNEAAETVAQCTGCMSCYEPCLHNIDVETALFSQRAEFVQSGIVTRPAGDFVSVGPDLEKAYLDAAPEEYVVPEAGAGLFPGASVLRSSPSTVTDIFKCFKVLGVDTIAAVPSLAADSGYNLWAAGFLNEFKLHAENVGRAMRRYKKIVVLSPKDFYAFTVLYPLFDVPVGPSVHLAEDVIGSLVMTRKPRKQVPGKIGYHDSCISGRHLERYDLPRRIIEHVTGRPPVELRRHHADSMCCGASGAWDIVNPEGAAEAGANIARSALEAGVDVLVTSGCECAANMTGRVEGLTVMDVVSLVARSL